jgi:DNA-binding beta-propeller fold protein YncE
VVPHLDRVALRIDPETNTVVDRIPLGDRGPGAEIAAADDMVWASVSSASYDFDRLVRIDPTTGSIVAWVEAAAGFPEVGAGFVWATGPAGVYRIDPATNRVAAVIDAGDCWVMTLDNRAFCVGPEGTVSIDPGTDVATQVPSEPTVGLPIIAVDGLIWGIDGDSLWAIDPETGHTDVQLSPPAGSTTWSLDAVVVDGALWATASSESNGPSDRLVRIDRQAMAIDCVVDTPTSEFGIAAGFGSIWLPVLGQPWLLRIDPAC